MGGTLSENMLLAEMPFNEVWIISHYLLQLNCDFSKLIEISAG